MKWQPLATWLLSDALFSRLQEESSVAEMGYRKARLLPTDPEWRVVWSAFLNNAPNRYMIRTIFAVHNNIHARAFEAHLVTQAREAKKFPANWDKEVIPITTNKFTFKRASFDAVKMRIYLL